MTLSRRDMLKAQAATIAAATAGISLPAAAQPVPGGPDQDGEHQKCRQLGAPR